MAVLSPLIHLTHSPMQEQQINQSKTAYPKNKNSKRPCESLADSLPCKALHLDVEELSEVTEPFNHLGRHAAVELDRERTTARNRMSRLGQQDRFSFQKGLNRQQNIKKQTNKQTLVRLQFINGKQKLLTIALGQFLSIFKAQSWLIIGENINTPFSSIQIIVIFLMIIFKYLFIARI